MKHIAIAIIIVLLLSACAAPTPAPTVTPVPPTATPEPTPTLSRVEPLLEAYLAGQQIDVSPLSPAEYQEFSVKLAEKMNEQRGANPVAYKNEAYIHPDDLRMVKDYDGHPDMEETITMYLAIAGKDSEGNLQIINEEGKTITIAHSADIDWNMVVTDPNDPRIDLAHTGPISKWTGEQFIFEGLSSGEQKIMPMILLDKTPGLIYFKSEQSGQMKPKPFYQCLKIETDHNGTPILARKIIVFPPAGFALYKEKLPHNIGDYSSSQELETTKFHSNLISNSVYYLKMYVNQESIFERMLFVSADGFTGVIIGNEAVTSLTGQTINNTDVILLGAFYFIEPAD